MLRASVLAASLLLLAACARSPEPDGESASRTDMTDREWQLVSLGEQRDPLGSGGRRPTVQFTVADGRAGGFGGCNRWSAPYTMSGDSLSFGAAVATKMACAEGMELETAFFEMLSATRRFSATDSTLTFLAEGAPLATFRPAAP